jgi:hypothetical protein
MSEGKQAGQTSTEVFESLTGFEEQAIVEFFGRTIGDLANADESMWHRALIFTVKRREGLADVDAHDAAMTLTLKDNITFFSADEADEEEAGKDEEPEQQPEEPLVSSLSSVS